MKFPFWSVRRPRFVPLEHLHFILYTRHGCHLCADAWDLLRRAQQAWGFQLRAVDIDADAELVGRYGHWVPVVVVNGKERFRGRINDILLTRLLQAEATRPRGDGTA